MSKPGKMNKWKRAAYLIPLGIKLSLQRGIPPEVEKRALSEVMRLIRKALMTDPVCKKCGLNLSSHIIDDEQDPRQPCNQFVLDLDRS